MQLDQHVPGSLIRYPLDLVLGIDVSLGWRMSVSSTPGETFPPGSYGISDTDDIDAVFDSEYAVLLGDARHTDELSLAIIHAVPIWLKELGTEFEIPGFSYCFHRPAVCLECLDHSECALCDKTGYVTHIYRSYLVAMCSVNSVFRKDTLLMPFGEPESTPDPPPMVRPPSKKRWFLTVPAAVLATIAMIVSIALRIALYSDVALPPPKVAQPYSGPSDSAGSGNFDAEPIIRQEGQPQPSAPLATSDRPPPDPALNEIVLGREPPRKPAAPPLLLPPPAQSPNQTSNPTPSPPPSPDQNTPPSPAQNPGQSQMPTTVPSTSKNWPATRLQTALSSLGFYTGPINGEMDDATKHSLSAFSACVSPTIKAKFGTGVAAMAEAAARHEFALGAKHCSIPTSTKPD